MNLTPRDLDLHAALGIPADLLDRAGVCRRDDRSARELLSLNGKPGDFAGIEYPYIHPVTGHRVTSRVRRDHPPLKADGMPEAKYMAAYGDNRHLFFAPAAAPLLQDTAAIVVIVESEKATLAATAAAGRAGRSVLAIGTGGCWGWRGRIGKAEDASGGRVDVRGPLSDFDLIAWPGRVAVILFDAQPNDSVRAARRALAQELTRRGADVRHAHLPDDDLQVNGPDDLIAARGDAALWTIIDSAVPNDFARSKKGAIIADDLDNIQLALLKLEVSLAYDAFAEQALINGRPADDVALDTIWVRISDSFRFRPSKEVLRTILTVDAQASTFHPVRDYLDALEWDGTPRLDSWLTTYAGAEPSAYVQAVGALPLIAAIRRVRRPGAKFDELLVLESPQGTFKSTALRALCPRDAWFSDDLPLGVDSKQVIERTSGRWIIEAAEMHGNRGREAEQLKVFLSRQVDGPVRLAYGRLPVTVARQFILIGTTNARTSYLKDFTGARRFWPVAVKVFDIEALRRDRDQLWAEAAEREAQGESIRLAPDLWSAAGAHQEQRRAADPWEELLEPLLDDDEDHVAVTAIWTALGVEANVRDNRHADRVAAIVQRFGFTEKRKFRPEQGGKPTWHWVRVPSGAEHSAERL